MRGGKRQGWWKKVLVQFELRWAELMYDKADQQAGTQKNQEQEEQRKWEQKYR